MNTINIFLFYSIFGNIFERFIMSFMNKDYVSGFMGTIFTPIYGIAILVLLFLHKKIKINNNLFKIIIEFFTYSIVLSLLELFGGILIENVFNKIYWNYENLKYNIGHYISLETAIFWGIMSLLAIYIIHPLYKKIEKFIPKTITIITSIIFIINFIFILIVK